MSPRAKIFADALALSIEDRAALANELLASLPPDHAIDMEDPDPEWAAEVERRARATMADPDDGIPWETARDKILTNLQSRQR